MVADFRKIPASRELAGFQQVHVRIPLDRTDLVWKYEKAGFRFVTLDYSLARPRDARRVAAPKKGVICIRRQEPDFEIHGFSMEGSRLMIDPGYRKLLGRNFWDRMIRNHCATFADFVYCKLDGRRKLMGCISCFELPKAIQLFLVLVHPRHQGKGIGSLLLQAAERAARAKRKRLVTNVVASNFEGANFYFRHGFRLEKAHVIMHYSAKS